MHFLDWTIVVAYLVYMIWDGIRMTKYSDKVEGYFLANRSLPWWAVGLSVMATQLSAITLVGTTGQAYSDGMRFIQFYYGLPIAMVILCMTAVPFFYRAKVFTAYEYLEKRFDAKTRSLTSFFFLMSRGLGVGVIIAAPSVILSIVLGWSEVATIFAIGLSTTVYTMFGGVQAVTWTDVKQMFVIFFGLAVCLIVIVSGLPEGVSMADGLTLAGASGKLNTIDTKFDLTEQYTLWSGLIGGLFLALSYFGCDQSQVQRFLTAKSVGEGRTSLLMSAFLKIPMQFFILLIGVMVFVFYQFNAPPMIFHSVEAAKAEATDKARFDQLKTSYEASHAKREESASRYLESARSNDSAVSDAAKAAYINANNEFLGLRKEASEFVKKTNRNDKFNDVNYVFPTFVLQNMPAGVIGLIIAAIFAAAMSSISAELNALATATVMDFYKRYGKKDGTDTHYVRIGKLATFLWGVFACFVAMNATGLGSLIEVVNKFGSFFYGSLLGVFVLAFVVKRANARGAFWGLLAGIFAVALVSYLPDIANFAGTQFENQYLLDTKDKLKIAFLWYNVVGCLVVVSVGYLLSLTVKQPLERA